MINFYRDKLVLVAGGTGFVGGHFVEELLRQGARVRVPIHERPLRIQNERIETVEADLTRRGDCRRVCEGVDAVVHAAGAVGAAGVGPASVMSGIAVSLPLTANLLEAAWAAQLGRILIFSSSTAYPAVEHPVKEEEMWTGEPHPAYLGYGWMRRYSERLCEYVDSKSDLGIAICRPTAVYGRHDSFDPVTGHFLPALIHRAAKRENPFVVWGTGEEVRDILHVTDFVRGSLLLLASHAVCDPVNIGTGQGTTVREVAELVLEAAGHDAEIEFDHTKPSTIPVRRADVSKARRLLGFKPQIGLKEGIVDTMRWYTETFPEARA